MGDKLIANYCVSLINFIISHDEQISLHLTYRHIGEILKADPASDDIQSAISILSSRFQTLHFHMELFDREGQVYDLTREELAHFLNSGELVHPHTGQPVEGADSLLVPYFRASKPELLREVQND